MSNSTGYILPGHREPIGDWPVERLMSALEDLLFDREHGYLPPEVQTSVDAVSAELFSREAGDSEAREERRNTLGRALERWFPSEAATIPNLRGEPVPDERMSIPERFAARAIDFVKELAPEVESTGLDRWIDQGQSPSNDNETGRDVGPEW
ncbi:MAG: hypothetical protein FD160_980 [Caulobacteraceae bacterium]|nr:MAG: hypothetical protein FD160_980 [Caulobacteraceae bacterium]